MQHISEVENVRSKKSREKFRSQASLVWCRFSGKSRKDSGLGREEWCWENNDFPQYVEILEYQGEISLDGQEIRQETYARIGYLPEERSLMPKLTVLSKFVTWRL